MNKNLHISFDQGDSEKQIQNVSSCKKFKPMAKEQKTIQRAQQGNGGTWNTFGLTYYLQHHFSKQGTSKVQGERSTRMPCLFFLFFLLPPLIPLCYLSYFSMAFLIAAATCHGECGLYTAWKISKVLKSALREAQSPLDTMRARAGRRPTEALRVVPSAGHAPASDLHGCLKVSWYACTVK